MQQTRRHILDILRERGDATVDEMVSELKTRIQHEITAVTVRHHLDILRSESLVNPPAVRRSGAPGRPQYVYSLTDKAIQSFPNNYQNVMNLLLTQLKSNLPVQQVNVIMEGVANKMITDANMPESIYRTIPMEVRLDHVVEYLSEHGYDARWELGAQGFLLHMRNCPYKKVAGEHGELCGMDMHLVAGLLGTVPRTMGRIAQHEENCTYLIPAAKVAATA